MEMLFLLSSQKDLLCSLGEPVARDWLLHRLDVEFRVLQLGIAALKRDAFSTPEPLDDVPIFLKAEGIREIPVRSSLESMKNNNWCRPSRLHFIYNCRDNGKWKYFYGKTQKEVQDKINEALYEQQKAGSQCKLAPCSGYF